MRTAIFSLVWVFLFISCVNSNELSGSVVKPSNEIERVRDHIDRLICSYDFYGRFSGTILVAHKDSIWYENSFGYADVESKKRNGNNSVYGIGSLTKQFTATAILKLVQNGRLNLTDKLSSFFPELGQTGDEITIHHLLSMSSGIYEDFSRSKSYRIDKVIFPASHSISTTGLVHYFGELSSENQPGKKYDYSNMNYILLAAIIEKISGQSYEDFLTANFWQSLNMSSTAFGRHHVDEYHLSRPYVGLPAKHTDPDNWHDSWVLGAGGVFSSARDIYKWMYCAANGKVLDSSYTNKLFQKQISTGIESYAYGWQIGMRKGSEYRYHDGGTLGYVCEAGFFPEHDIYMVLLTNHTHDLKEIGKSVRLNKALVREIHNILFNEPFTALPIPNENSLVNLSGSFKVDEYGYTISSKAKSLNIQTNNAGPSILDLPFWLALKEDTKTYKKAVKIALAFGKEDFGYVRKMSDFMMKTLITNKKLAKIWSEITGDKGKFLDYNFYRIPGGDVASSYWVRLVYERKEVGLRLSFNKRGKMMGMHIDPSFSFGGPLEVEATIIDSKLVFIDGFKYGYPDAYVIQKEGRWYLKTSSAELLLKK